MLHNPIRLFKKATNECDTTRKYVMHGFDFISTIYIQNKTYIHYMAKRKYFLDKNKTSTKSEIQVRTISCA